jgi:hypothetical protein
MGIDRFDELSRELAAATSRRQALRLLAGALGTGVLSMLGAGPAQAAPRCRRTGEKCDDDKRCCTGVCCGEVCCAAGQVCQSGRCVTPPPPPPPGGPDRVICICGDGTALNICATLDCGSGLAQDAICGPACAAHGGESATGCVPADPTCAA